jgi:hypothetical protein
MRVAFLAEAFEQRIEVKGDTVTPRRTKGDDRANKNDDDWCLA